MTHDVIFDHRVITGPDCDYMGISKKGHMVHQGQMGFCLADDIHAWLKTNTPSQWSVSKTYNKRPEDNYLAEVFHIEFEDPAHAMLFKLTWAGK